MSLLHKMQQSIKAVAEAKKTKTTALRFTKADFNQLEETANYYNTNKSEVIRIALINLYNALEAEKNNYNK